MPAATISSSSSSSTLPLSSTERTTTKKKKKETPSFTRSSQKRHQTIAFASRLASSAKPYRTRRHRANQNHARRNFRLGTENQRHRGMVRTVERYRHRKRVGEIGESTSESRRAGKRDAIAIEIDSRRDRVRSRTVVRQSKEL